MTFSFKSSPAIAISLAIFFAATATLGVLSYAISGNNHPEQDSNNTGRGSELRLLFLIHRHGDRSPYTFGLKDPYRNVADSIWDLGLSMLTNEGRQRMYKLGMYLGKRYSDFLTSSPHEVYSMSSDVDRCITSAQLVLAGLYKPEGRWKWSQELNWQPIPIHTRPQYSDPMLNVESVCPVRDVEHDRVFGDDNIKESFYTSELGKELKDKLADHYGYNFSTPYDFYDAFSTLSVERETSLELPEWLTESFPKLARISYHSELLWTHTDLLKRLYTGVIIDHIVSQMKARKLADDSIIVSSDSSNDNERKSSSRTQTRLFHYSTHDTNIHSILNTLAVYQGQVNELPNFGSTILIELRKNEHYKPRYSVRLFYLADSLKEDQSLRELTMTSCLEGEETECSLENFDAYTKKYQLTPDTWSRECVGSTGS